MSLLEVSGLSIHFGATEVVNDVSFALQRGERFGIIGESGSGKTLTALAVTGLLPEGAVASGTIRIDGVPLPSDEKSMARLRGKRMGMVFQEPMTALNPLMRVNDQIGEAIRLNGLAGTVGHAARTRNGRCAHPEVEAPAVARCGRRTGWSDRW